MIPKEMTVGLVSPVELTEITIVESELDTNVKSLLGISVAALRSGFQFRIWKV